jgi:Right handed beta helix region
MILDSARALSCAGVSCLAAALGSGARAAVYPGCAVPPTTFNHVWYVDPVHGKTPADGGDGSRAAPWNSLQGVVSSAKQPGYRHPMLSTVPYDHYPQKNAEGARFYADGPSSDPSRVQPGDEILLMGGRYGDISIGSYGVATTNPAFVTIAAAPGQTPVLSTLGLTASSYFAFSRIKVQSIAEGAPRSIGLVKVGDQGALLPSSNIVFTNMLVSSADDTSGWTKPQWLARVRSVGIVAMGSNHGANTTCVSVTNSHISNIIYGASVSANNMLFSGNEIDHFGDDGIDYSASNILIARNYIHDDLDLANGAHMDGMQGYPGAYANVVIDSNRVIRQTDPNLPFPTYLMAIDAFDGDWTNLTVTNNVVVTSSCWGIGFASVHGGKIVNNTVLDDGSAFTKNATGKVVCRPGISVSDKTHQGSSSNDVIIRNNIANGLGIYDEDPNMTMDHNVCVAMDGRCAIPPYVNGPNWGDRRPGEYAGHNIIDGRGAGAMFVSFDPAKFVFDLRLRPDARAIGAGNPADAPRVDIAGRPRGSRIDAGAYQFRPGE